MTRLISAVAVAACCTALAVGVSARAAGAPRETFAVVLDRFLTRTDEGPVAYRALRHLEARNLKFGASAWMDVWTEADEQGGFRYQVASEGGSGYIRRKVFLGALDGEQKMWRDGDPKRAKLSQANYSFKEGDRSDDALATLAISPKRKDVLLVDGWLFVRQEDGDLVRIEGQLSKTPSFWTRRVEIVRRYGRVGGAHVPLEIESVAQVLIAGRSTFRMTYEYESINGMHVGDPQPRATEDPAQK